jgi:hypothetical protein
MSDRDEKIIEKVFDDAMERAWEEAKLRDIMTLYHMWQSGELSQYKEFHDLFEKFFHYDDEVRNMDEKEYFTIEHIVVDTICKSSTDLAHGLCAEREPKK